MTPPISPSDLQRVLKTLPPEAPDPFPHLADQTPDALLRRKVRITQIAQRCEQERHVIDAELLCLWRCRTTLWCSCPWWMGSQAAFTNQLEYDPEVRDAIKGLQGHAQRDGRAQPLVSIYLCLTQET